MFSLPVIMYLGMVLLYLASTLSRCVIQISLNIIPSGSEVISIPITSLWKRTSCSSLTAPMFFCEKSKVSIQNMLVLIERVDFFFYILFDNQSLSSVLLSSGDSVSITPLRLLNCRYKNLI